MTKDKRRRNFTAHSLSLVLGMSIETDFIQMQEDNSYGSQNF